MKQHKKMNNIVIIHDWQQYPRLYLPVVMPDLDSTIYWPQALPGTGRAHPAQTKPNLAALVNELLVGHQASGGATSVRDSA
jgi:hypothetical protein